MQEALNYNIRALLLIFQSSSNTHVSESVSSAPEEKDGSTIRHLCRVLSNHQPNAIFFEVCSALLIVIVCTTVTKYITN